MPLSFLHLLLNISMRYRLDSAHFPYTMDLMELFYLFIYFAARVFTSMQEKAPITSILFAPFYSV